MDTLSISMFRNLEQQAIRDNNAHEVAHKNAVRLIIANKFYTNLPENTENTSNTKPTENADGQEPKSYRLNYLA